MFALCLVLLAWSFLRSTPSLPCPSYLRRHFLSIPSPCLHLSFCPKVCSRTFIIPCRCFALTRGIRRSEILSIHAMLLLSRASPSRVLLTLHNAGIVQNVGPPAARQASLEDRVFSKRTQLSGAYWKKKNSFQILVSY